MAAKLFPKHLVDWMNMEREKGDIREKPSHPDGPHQSNGLLHTFHPYLHMLHKNGAVKKFCIIQRCQMIWCST